ncbi:MAG: type I methionyl aminopeptidase [Erysipelotrichaceae bacterium]
MNKDTVTLSEETVSKLAELKKQGYKIPSLKIIKSEREIQAIKESAKINTALLDYLESKLEIGVTTLQIDEWTKAFYKEHQAIAAPYHYNGYPKHLCTSINEVVCHGIPENRSLKEGDIINLDVSTIYQGYFSDASRMYGIGTISEEDQRLIRVTKECLEKGIKEVKPFEPINKIGEAIEKHAKAHGFSVVRELGGHGIGLAFHEDPFIYHYKRLFKDTIMVPGMIFTIEPMINAGKKEVYLDEKDEWTIRTSDHKKSAQVEHMILVTEDGFEILSK